MIRLFIVLYFYFFIITIWAVALFMSMT